jgi:hypothetical protein
MLGTLKRRLHVKSTPVPAAERTSTHRRELPKRLEALDLIALSIDARQTEGTPRHAKAKRIAYAAVAQWKRDFANRGKCPHCGKAIR